MFIIPMAVTKEILKKCSNFFVDINWDRGRRGSVAWEKSVGLKGEEG